MTCVSLAERGGFEPPIGYEPIHAFQACDFNHSSTSPASLLPFREAPDYSKNSKDHQNYLPLPQDASLSCSRIAGFSSVDTSCVIVSPLASTRSNRRMILPERVFGKLSPKRISLGLAIGPISLPTQLRSSLASLTAAPPCGRERL